VRTRSSHHLNRRPRGFTLLEMGIVVIVVAIVSVTVVPAWNSLTGTRQAAAGEEVERRLVAARSQAVSQGRPIGLHIDPATDTVLFYTITATGAAPTVLTMVDGQPDPGVNLAVVYPGADVTSVINGSGVAGAATLWFGFDGAPELRNAAGALTGAWTSDAIITLAGGSTVTVRRATGMVVR
jgi:prepilin-type N-terminal cleavage/methylation domain-containing protein